MQATHKTSSRTCNVLLSLILFRLNRIALQTLVYRILTTQSGQSKRDILIHYVLGGGYRFSYAASSRSALGLSDF